MKLVILAGGFGSRLAEETDLRPKPLVEIADRPIIFHIMNWYSKFGIKEFVICLGYKGFQIKDYFMKYSFIDNDLVINMSDGSVRYLSNRKFDWQITCIDTGMNSMTAGRIKRVESVLGNEPFMVTYGDGLGNVHIDKLIQSHLQSKKIATLTTVPAPGRFGSVELIGNQVTEFGEKTEGKNSRINAGFFVFNKEVLDLISGDNMSLESELLPRLAQMSELNSYPHDDFWHPMDTLRDKRSLENLVRTGKAPWLID